MIKKHLFLISALISISFIFTKSKTLFYQPSYFPKATYNFNKNPLDSLTIELGRALFYDPILSANNTVSCASCHSPYNAFAHTDHELSHGINDSIGNRNAPALFNLAWQNSFMWDGAVNHLDMQALAPISHPNEMGSNIIQVINKLSNNSLYKKSFNKVFKDSTITSSKILKALSQFQLTLVSANSKYDRVQLGTDVFTNQERNGYELFKKNCNTCHTEPLFTNHSFENNGLQIDPVLNDFGRFNITQIDADKFKFKVPSLRNLSYTYPYMHDGRFLSIKEVMNHYTKEAPEIKSYSVKLKIPIKLNANEKIDIIAFLLTLNDKEFVFNKKHQYSNITELTKE
jgi:cytochrome c peroxidase